MTQTPLDVALELVGQGFKLFPLKPLSKIPAVKWGTEYSDDPAQIEKWERELGPACNWGIPTGWRNGLIVVDLDSPDADAWWLGKGFPLGAEVSTPRGGKHYYYSYSGDIEFETNAKKIHPGVDIRADGGFVVAPGGQTSSFIDIKYGDGKYEGSLRSVPDAPEAVLDLLPQRHTYSSSTRPTSPQVASATPGEGRALERIVQTLESLSVTGWDGPGWDDTVFRMACQLGRMVNSPEYALTEEQAVSILLTHSPSDENWGDGQILDKWESARKQTKDQYASRPSQAPDYVDIDTALNHLPRHWEDFYWNGSDRKRLRELAKALHSEGVPIDIAHTLVWQSKANRPSKSTWWIIESVYENAPEVVMVGEDLPEVVIDAPAKATRGAFTILTQAERDLLEVTPNFIDRYLFVAKERFGDVNRQYHTVNAWGVLSNVLGDLGILHTKRGSLLLNIWIHVLGPSGSGKGDAKMLWRSLTSRGLVDGFAGVSLGGNASENALASKLLDRDGKVSLFHTDEASGKFYKLIHQKGGWASGLREFVTDAYDGMVDPILRQGDPTLADKRAERVVFNMWLNGTWDGVTDEIDETDVSSGFFGRSIWGVGREVLVTEDSLSPDMASELEVKLGEHPLIVSLGEALLSARVAWRNKTFQPISMSEEAHQVILRGRVTLMRLEESSRHAEKLRAINMRLGLQAWKCAALHALYEGRDRIEYTDALVAVRCLEDWGTNILDILDAVEAGEWRKQMEQILDYIASRKGTTLTELYRNFKNMKQQEIDSARDRLIAERRIGKQMSKGEGYEKWIALS